jgi:Tol biopolymer transport system component
VFIGNRGGSPGLWSVRVADGKPQGEPEQLKADFGDAYPIGFARDGSLFYSVSTRQSDIYVAGLDPARGTLTSEPKRVNELSLGNASGRVAWLPNGQSLSFWSMRNGRSVLVVHALATGEEREVPGLTGGYTGWFPDGRSLMSQQVSGQARVFRQVDANTGEAQATWTVPDLPRASDRIFAYLPNLMTMLFVRQDVPCEAGICYVMIARDLDTGRDREIFRISAGYLWTPSVSPDGAELAFFTASANDAPEHSLMIAPTTGGAPREIYRGTDAFNLASPLTWTRDGSHVLAYCGESGREAFLSFSTKGGPPEKAPLHLRINSASSVVSPDGTRIAFAGSNGKGEIWVMTGLFQGAKPALAR